jgi:hypothetical protein
VNIIEQALGQINSKANAEIETALNTQIKSDFVAAIESMLVISEWQNGQKLDFISKLAVLDLLNKAAL